MATCVEYWLGSGLAALAHGHVSPTWASHLASVSLPGKVDREDDTVHGHLPVISALYRCDKDLSPAAQVSNKYTKHYIEI